METLTPHDALLLADIQNDFFPGGGLEIGDGDAIIPILLNYLPLFQIHSLPIFLTRDWHPARPLLVHAPGRSMVCALCRRVSRVSAAAVVSDSRYGS